MNVSKGLVLVTIGMLCVCAGVVSDTFVRLRMRDVGYRPVLFRRSAYDYKMPFEYLKVRREHRWSPLPVYVIWPLFIVGFVLLVMGIGRL